MTLALYKADPVSILGTKYIHLLNTKCLFLA